MFLDVLLTKSRRKSLFLTIVANDFKDAACDIGKVNDIDLKTSGGYYSINLSVVSEQRDIPAFRGVHREMAYRILQEFCS